MLFENGKNYQVTGIYSTFLTVRGYNCIRLNSQTLFSAYRAAIAHFSELIVYIAFGRAEGFETALHLFQLLPTHYKQRKIAVLVLGFFNFVYLLLSFCNNKGQLLRYTPVFIYILVG